LKKHKTILIPPDKPINHDLHEKIQISLPVEFEEREIKIALATELFREGKLTLKQSAELAELCVEDFLKELSRRKVSIINWDEEELKREIRNADSF